MNARGSLLTRYALFLFKRELSILSYFLVRGRKRRVLMGPYWQASFLPGLLGLFFVAMRLIGMDVGPAAAAVVLFCAGALVTEVLLYEQNKFTWPIFQRIIAPDKFGRAVKDRLGYDGFPGRDGWRWVTMVFPVGTAGARSRRACRSKCGGLCSRACSKRGRRRHRCKPI